MLPFFIEREARIGRGYVGFSTLKVKRVHTLATPQHSRWLLLIFLSHLQIALKRKFTAVGIAKTLGKAAASEDTKICRPKPPMESVMDRSPSLSYII